MFSVSDPFTRGDPAVKNQYIRVHIDGDVRVGIAQPIRALSVGLKRSSQPRDIALRP